jgi:transcriptional regulator with XRE-family HTH domain
MGMTPFGVKITEFRTARKMSHDELARQLKLSAAELTTWQNGFNGVPSLVMLYQIERILKLTPFEIGELKAAARISAPEVVIPTQGLSISAVILLHLFTARLPRMADKTIVAIRKLLEKSPE